MSKLKPRSPEEFDKDLADFNIELAGLQKKYNMKLTAEPYIVQGMILAKPVCLDATQFNQGKQDIKKIVKS